MSEPKWPLRSVVDAMHDMQIAEHGGAGGIRDQGLLDCALTRPKNLYAYGNTDICELAASLAYGIAKNHPFVDGIKRIAFLTAFVFLKINGLQLRANEIHATLVMLDIASGLTEESQLAHWFKANTIQEGSRLLASK
jgi:death-on-curing protein